MLVTRTVVGFRPKDDEAFECQVPVPGVAPEAIEIETQGRLLHLRITDRAGTEVRLPLPEAADAEALSAAYAHGMLTLRAPIHARYRTRQVPVTIA